MNQETEEPGEWVDTMTASRQFSVSPAYLYKLAYSDPPQLEYRITTKGRLRPKLEFRRTSLEKWDARRGDRFKRRQESESPGRTERVAALL